MTEAAKAAAGAKMAEALEAMLRAGVCDPCYEEGCINGCHGGLCPCRGACHTQEHEAEKKARAALDEWAHRAPGRVWLFGLWRGGERRADVVVLMSGKCVVAWPTSVIVYDSLEAAEAVHITHMGGRGEATEFRPEDGWSA